MLSTQTEWLAKAAALNDTQRQRWENGPIAGRMRAIASDLGLYAIMENNGFSRPQIDHCLNDDAAMKRLAAQTEAAVNAGIEGTPGFCHRRRGAGRNVRLGDAGTAIAGTRIARHVPSKAARPPPYFSCLKRMASMISLTRIRLAAVVLAAAALPLSACHKAD